MRDDKRTPRLREQVHEAIRRRYFSRRTEEAYVHWIKRFIYFSGRRHPAELGEPEVTAFLNHLAAEREVAASTQNQALSALLFLYKEVLGRELPRLDGLQRASRPPRVPAVLTLAEVETRSRAAAGHEMADREPAVRLGAARAGVPAASGQGCRPRVPADPGARRQGREGPRDDAAGKAGRADALAPGARPHAPRASGAGSTPFRPRRAPPTRRTAIRRHHLDESVPQRAVKEALRAAGIAKHASCNLHARPEQRRPGREEPARPVTRLVGRFALELRPRLAQKRDHHLDMRRGILRSEDVRVPALQEPELLVELRQSQAGRVRELLRFAI